MITTKSARRLGAQFLLMIRDILLCIKVILIKSYDTQFALFTRQNLRFGLVGQFRVLKFHVLFIAVLSGILVRFGKNDVADTN